MADVKLPELGEGVTEGELVKWLVKPGDQIRPDQAIAEIMTDKATVEVPSPVAGTVKELKFKVGDIIKVESVLITVEGGSSTSSPSTSATTPTKVGSANTITAAAATSAFAKGTTPSAATSSASAPSISNATSTLVKLPELGEGVTEGELVKWLVKPGDQIRPDQAIAEIMTDKATVEVPSPTAGLVKELKFKVGDIVKVESVMITLEGTAGSAVATSAPNQPAHSVHSSNTNGQSQKNVSLPAAASQAALASSAHSSSAGVEFYPPTAELRVLATPATRRLAREMGIDINQIQGTGLAGRVTRDDIMKQQGGAAVISPVSSATGTRSTAAPGATTQIPKPAYQSSMGASEERVAMRGIRKKIAENMQMAKAIIPHFTLMDEAEVTELVSLRESLKDVAEKNQTKITFLPFVMKALIATIREFPMFNASIDDAASEVVYKKYFNIGFAADTPNGLVVPVIKNADQKTILEISKEILDLAKRARDGKLKPDEMKGATITITNIGSVGGTYATPIINHPEVAILGMYKIQDKPIIRDGQLAAIKVMNYTITADHRLIDGAVAANFLRAFITRIQKPGQLMLDMH